MNMRTKVAVKQSNKKSTNSISHIQKSESTQTSTSPINQILRLQRAIGNQAVQGLFESDVIQAKLKIGKPRDKYEQEADRIAEQVMKMTVDSKQKAVGSNENTIQKNEEEEKDRIQTKPLANHVTSLVQRQVEEEEKKKREEEMFQAKEKSSSGVKETADVESSVNNLKGKGEPLPETVRNYFEPRFGYDFSGVRIHTENWAAKSAQSIHAKAFTIGNNIVFGEGQYNVDSQEGRHLFAHELTHIAQQRSSANIKVHHIQRVASPNLGIESISQSILCIGSVGPEVLHIQQLLNQSGAYPPLVVDGIFGPLTERSVLAFQSSRGLNEDGIVDPDTRSTLVGEGGGGRGGGSCLRECNYEPGEVDASAISPGEVQFGGFSSDPYVTKVLFWDFQAGKSDIKKGHTYGVKSVVHTYDLGKKDSPHQVVEIVGFTDCVASEAINRPIRRKRAQNVWQELYLKGAKKKNLGSAGPASPCATVVDNTTRIGRAKNRSALVILLRRKKPKIPTDPPKPKPPIPKPPRPQPVCGLFTDTPTTVWGLKSDKGVNVVLGKGPVEADFILRNEWSKCKYLAKYKGTGIGVSVSSSISFLPDFERLETNSRKLPGEMDSTTGTSAKMKVAQVSFPPIPAGHTRMYLWPDNDNLFWVKFKGTELGIGSPLGAFKADGRFTVIKPIP